MCTCSFWQRAYVVEEVQVPSEHVVRVVEDPLNRPKYHQRRQEQIHPVAP